MIVLELPPEGVAEPATLGQEGSGWNWGKVISFIEDKAVILVVAGGLLSLAASQMKGWTPPRIALSVAGGMLFAVGIVPFVLQVF